MISKRFWVLQEWQNRLPQIGWKIVMKRKSNWTKCFVGLTSSVRDHLASLLLALIDQLMRSKKSPERKRIGGVRLRIHLKGLLYSSWGFFTDLHQVLPCCREMGKQRPESRDRDSSHFFLFPQLASDYNKVLSNVTGAGVPLANDVLLRVTLLSLSINLVVRQVHWVYLRGGGNSPWELNVVTTRPQAQNHIEEKLA